MTLHPHALPPVPDATAAAVEAASPRGNLYVDLRAEFGSLYTDELFADLYPPSGRPVEILPWRLALVLVMQYIEGLTDRQPADAVRRCLDWKYALSLEIPDPGFDFTLLHDFRVRLLQHAAGQRLLDTFLLACKARGLLKSRGVQRTDSTHVLAAVRTLHHLECLVETLHFALNQLSAADPGWVQTQIPADWFPWYGLQAEQSRFPKEATKHATNNSAKRLVEFEYSIGIPREQLRACYDTGFLGASVQWPPSPPAAPREDGRPAHGTTQTHTPSDSSGEANL